MQPDSAATGDVEKNGFTTCDDVVLGCGSGYFQRIIGSRRRDEAATRVPDDLALKVNLLGTEAMVRERLRIYRDAGVTTLRVDPAGTPLDARLATLGRLMELIKATP